MKSDVNILIYAEGGFKLGLGNIYRSISLADALRKKGKKNIKFITSSTGYASDVIYRNGYSLLSLKRNKLLDKIIELNPDILITDFLGLSENFAKKIKEKTKSKLVIIGNISKANKYADIVINAIIGTNFKNKKHIENGTLYLEGPKYLVLGNEFIEKNRSYVHRGKLEKVLLLFGGTDQANFTCKVLKDLLDYDKENKFVLVIGAGFKYEKELDKLIKKYSDSDISLHKNASNVSELMLSSDFVITSAGTSLFEGFCLGIPTVGLFQNRSQKKVFRNFFMTMRYQDVDNIGKFINSIYSNANKYNKGINLVKAGEGRWEIIDNILKL